MQGTPLERCNFIFFSCLLKYDLSIGLPLTKHPDKTFWSNVFINGLQLQQFKFERGNVEGSVLISSVRSSSVHHGLLHIRKQATFSDFSNSSDSKVKVKVKGPNMCYIFEKHGIQGYRI